MRKEQNHCLVQEVRIAIQDHISNCSLLRSSVEIMLVGQVASNSIGLSKNEVTISEKRDLEGERRLRIQRYKKNKS
jgi:hypothetical protein